MIPPSTAFRHTLPASIQGSVRSLGQFKRALLGNFSRAPTKPPADSKRVVGLTVHRFRYSFCQNCVKTWSGLALLKATTVHQELRVLRRMLNVAVRKKFLFANPCSGVEFPARVDGLFRPHYVTWSERRKIEVAGPIALGESTKRRLKSRATGPTCTSEPPAGRITCPR